MNFRILLLLHAVILVAMALGFLASLGIALLMESDPAQLGQSLRGFGLSIAVCLLLAAPFGWAGRGHHRQLFQREALAVVGSGWLLASAVGALPYLLILPELSWVDGLFESASGLTTTGASVLSDLEAIAPSLHFWRALSQWMGGLGVVVFFVAILSFLGAAAKALFSRESSANAADLRTARIQSGVIRLLMFYLGLSVTCTVAFHLCGLTWFDALLHMLTTISTGGFSNRSGSIADFNNPALEWTMILFMTIGGTSFVLMLDVLRGRLRAIGESSELRAYLLLILLASLCIGGFLLYDIHQEDSPLAALRLAAFQVVSILTTTGFATADFDGWLPVTHVILFLLMIVGGCAGSTSGGTKVIRFLVAAKLIRQQIEKAYRQRVIRPLTVNGRCLAAADQEMIAVYLVLLGMVAVLSLLVVALMEPALSFAGVLSATAACLFNIGPGFAEVGPTRNFAFFHDSTKLFLSLLMIAGRLELFAILALFSPALWKRF